LQGPEFYTNVFLIPLGSVDVVLSIQWLSALETIKWNLKELKMEFYFAGNRHILRGFKGPKVKEIGKKLPKAIKDGVCFDLKMLLS